MAKIYTRQNLNPPSGTSPTPEEETIRILVNLKQRFSKDSNGVRLVNSVYHIKKPRIGRNPKIPLDKISQEINEECMFKDRLNRMAELLRKRGVNTIMHYQLESWYKILRASEGLEDTKYLIISAPTGFGKTESFLIPVIDGIMKDDSLAIFVYPRRELIKDQLARILRLYPIIESVYGNSIRVGLQFEGIREKLAWTIGNYQKPKWQVVPFWDLRDSRVEWVNHYLWKWKSKNHEKLTTENDLFEISMVSPNKDFARLKLVDKCPVCGKGKLGIEIWYRTNKREMRLEFVRDSKDYQELPSEYSVIKCNSCHHTFEISLAREHHLKKNINVLLTTVESLEMLISDPDFRKFISKRLKFVVFDEIHVYHGMYGNHVSHVVRRIKDLVRDSAVFIGASATIDSPEEFAKKFFQVSSAIPIEPLEEDKTDIINGKQLYEHYYFIKAPENVYELSTYIQTAMFLGHSFIPDGKRALFFFDSRDLVYRATKQLVDAESWKELWKFRVNPQDIEYNGVSCPGYHKRCYTTCPIYQEGECWYSYSMDVLRVSPRNIALKQDEDILAVTAYSRTYTKDSLAKLINTTSVLELGIDDEKIISVGQYKAPHTVYSFIQRIGRAGRALDTDTHVFVILGNDVSDLFYYRRADKITSEEFKLPLNPENPVIKEMHNDLRIILNRVLKAYKLISSPSYIDKIACTWKVMTEGTRTREKYVGLCPCFVGFLQEILDIDFESKRYNIYKSIFRNRDKLKKLVGKAIDDRLRSIEEIVQEYGKNPAVLISEAGGMLETLEENLGQEEEFRQVISIVQEINKRISEGTASDIDSLLKTAFEKVSILEGRFGFENEELGNKLQEIKAILRKLKTGTVSVDILEINKLRYEIAALRQLYNPEAQFSEGAIVSKSPLRIIKYLLRAQYFFCKACAYNNHECMERAHREGWRKLRYFVPMAYFEEPHTVVVEIEKEPNQTKTILSSVTDILFSYIPYKINIENDETFYTIVPPELKVISENEGEIEIEIGRYFEGISWHIDGETKIEPRTIHAKEFPLDRYGIGIVKYCDTCHRYYPESRTTCPICRSRLRAVRLYSSPIINRTFKSTVESQEPIFENDDFRLYLADIKAILELSGIEGRVIPLRWNRTTGTYQPTYRGARIINGRLRYPLSIPLDTRGLILHLSREYVSSLLQREIVYDEDLESSLKRRLRVEGVSNIKKQAELQRKIKVLQDNKTRLIDFLRQYKQGDPEDIVAHTIAHLLTIVISAVTGINPEDLWYGWKKDENGIIIAVWEKFEGGAGIVETYRDLRRDKPFRILDELTQTVNCPVHKAEQLFLSFLLTSDEPKNIFDQNEEKYEYSEFETLTLTKLETKKTVFEKYFEKRYKYKRENYNEIINEIADETGINIDDVKENAPICFDGCPHCIGVTYCIAGKNEQYNEISLRVAKEFIKDVIRRTTDEIEVLDLLNRGGVIAEFRDGEYTILLI